MAYNIVITESATKEIKRIPAKMQDRILEKIDDLAQEPKPNGYKKLKSFDVPSSDYDDYYRVVYTIENEQITIFVLKIAHRKDVYE